jgi:transposase
MGVLLDKSGQRFGQLLVLNEYKNGQWKCECDCGETIWVRGSNLKESGGTRSCGCSRVKDITGERYGRLVVTSQIDSTINCARWSCLCDCGKTHEAYGHQLRVGDVKSCGCFLVDYHKYPQERIDDYIEMYLEGFLVSEIAAKYNLLSTSYIYEVLNREGITPNGFPSRNIDTPAIWLQQYRFGLTPLAIASKAKVNIQKVKYWLKKQGIDTISDAIQKKTQKRRSQAETLFEVYKGGYSCKDLADIFDLSLSFTWKLMKEFYSDQLRDRSQVRRLAYQKESALTNNSRAVNLATDRNDLKPITHKTKDLRWGQDNYDINRREHIL